MPPVPGVLTIVLTAATAVVLWRWSVALAVLVFVNLGACATFVYLHGAPALLVSGQVLAITLSAVLLGAAQWLRHPTPSLHQPGNWLLRTFALVFISGAWWFIDPGVRVPAFAQAETDMLLWLALCGMITLTLTNNPLFVGVGLLLWSVPTYALALVLLPGSGLPALLGHRRDHGGVGVCLPRAGGTGSGDNACAAGAPAQCPRRPDWRRTH